MACSCQKSNQAVSALGAKATAKAKPGEQWEAVLPSGKVMTFDLRWQAQAAVARLGGRTRRVTIPQPSAGAA